VAEDGESPSYSRPSVPCRLGMKINDSAALGALPSTASLDLASLPPHPPPPRPVPLGARNSISEGRARVPYLTS